MKLTNLNCPQCNGLLNQERDMFFCTSCGSAFAVDYDENDVKYTQLITEAERTKMMLQKDVNVMQTDYVLREQMARNEQQREISRQRKKAVKQGAAGIGMYIVALVISIIPMIFTSVYLVRTISRSSRKLDEQREQERTALVETVTEDMHFLENAVAGGQRLVDLRRQEPISDGRYDEDRTAIYRNDATIDSVYIIRTSGYNSTGLLLIYRFSYEYEDTGEIFTLYDCVELTDLKRDDYGYMVEEYFPKEGVHGDMYYSAYFDKDQLIREMFSAAKSSFKPEEIEIPDTWKEGRA